VARGCASHYAQYHPGHARARTASEGADQALYPLETLFITLLLEGLTKLDQLHAWPMFAPVYRPSDGQQTHLVLKQERDRKRKRERYDDHPESSDSNESSQQIDVEESELDIRTHSVSTTDPYHVAGYPREVDLPPAPFPHAAINPQARVDKETVEEQLATLNPPLYTPKTSPDDPSASLTRQHVENLTTILHTCMLKEDWQRATRAWGLLLRTEVAGRGIDVRWHGRWGIGAELLMQSSINAQDGFKLAREYYDRLILQYPHTPRSQGTTALIFYPALFNIWIYEVQHRYQRISENHVDHISELMLRRQELEDALPISQRMDELLLSPPYDTSVELLKLRAMVGLWVSDLRNIIDASPSDQGSQDDAVGGPETRPDRGDSLIERERALTLFRKAKELGADLPDYVLELMNDASDAISF